MDDLIYRDSARRIIESPRSKEQMLNMLASLPSQPDRKPGKWIYPNPFTDTLVCSECDWNIPSEEFMTNFCPNCGLPMENSKMPDMRGEQDGDK